MLDFARGSLSLIHNEAAADPLLLYSNDHYNAGLSSSPGPSMSSGPSESSSEGPRTPTNVDQVYALPNPDQEVVESAEVVEDEEVVESVQDGQDGQVGQIEQDDGSVPPVNDVPVLTPDNGSQPDSPAEPSSPASLPIQPGVAAGGPVLAQEPAIMPNDDWDWEFITHEEALPDEPDVSEALRRRLLPGRWVRRWLGG